MGVGGAQELNSDAKEILEGLAQRYERKGGAPDLIARRLTSSTLR